MSLHTLPPELLLQLVSYLRRWDICALTFTNRRLAAVFTPVLFQFATDRRTYPQTIRSVLPPVLVTCTLHHAVWRGYERLFRVLLERGFDINCKSHTKPQATLLHYAAWGGSEGIVRFLLDNGFDVNARDTGKTRFDGTRPLHLAVLKGHEGVVRLLVSRGANVNARDNCGHPALFYSKTANWKGPEGAPTKWSPSIFRFLIENGAEINAHYGFAGATALHEAIDRWNLEMIEILLDMGASTAIRRYSGETASEWAVYLQNREVIKLLQMRGVIPLLEGKHYDERQPRGSMEYWHLACGKGLKNHLRALGKAFRETPPTAGNSALLKYKEKQLKLRALRVEGKELYYQS